MVTSGVTHGLRFASCSASWRIPQFEDGVNGWSRRPVALHTVSYPHQCEHPAVNLGRRGTHRAAQKGAQAQRAVIEDLDTMRFRCIFSMCFSLSTRFLDRDSMDMLEFVFPATCNHSSRSATTSHSTGALDPLSQYRRTGTFHSTGVLNQYFVNYLNPSKHFAYNPQIVVFAFCFGLNVLPADWYLRGLPMRMHMQKG